MAKPTSAFFRAGPSFVPSPVTATTSLLSLILLFMMPRTKLNLSMGWDRARTRSRGQIVSSFSWDTLNAKIRLEGLESSWRAPFILQKRFVDLFLDTCLVFWILDQLIELFPFQHQKIIIWFDYSTLQGYGSGWNLKRIYFYESLKNLVWVSQSSIKAYLGQTFFQK